MAQKAIVMLVAVALEHAGLHLAADRLVYLSHWLTPLGRAKRFDTRFFIAAVPDAQTAAHDGAELLEQMWIAPKEALARKASLKLLTPTQNRSRRGKWKR